MYNSLKENLSSLKSAFANSADFTVRDMILNSELDEFLTLKAYEYID